MGDFSSLGKEKSPIFSYDSVPMKNILHSHSLSTKQTNKETYETKQKADEKNFITVSPELTKICSQFTKIKTDLKGLSYQTDKKPEITKSCVKFCSVCSCVFGYIFFKYRVE